MGYMVDQRDPVCLIYLLVRLFCREFRDGVFGLLMVVKKSRRDVWGTFLGEQQIDSSIPKIITGRSESRGPSPA